MYNQLFEHKFSSLSLYWHLPWRGGRSIVGSIPYHCQLTTPPPSSQPRNLNGSRKSVLYTIITAVMFTAHTPSLARGAGLEVNCIRSMYHWREMERRLRRVGRYTVRGHICPLPVRVALNTRAIRMTTAARTRSTRRTSTLFFHFLVALTVVRWTNEQRALFLRRTWYDSLFPYRREYAPTRRVFYGALVTLSYYNYRNPAARLHGALHTGYSNESPFSVAIPQLERRTAMPTTQKSSALSHSRHEQIISPD